MLVHAFLAVATAHEHDHRPAPGDVIPLTCCEIQHLFAALTTTVRPAASHLGWFAVCVFAQLSGIPDRRR